MTGKVKDIIMDKLKYIPDDTEVKDITITYKRGDILPPRYNSKGELERDAKKHGFILIEW